jgi:hypothetical protein
MPLAGIVAWQGPGTEGATNGAYVKDGFIGLVSHTITVPQRRPYLSSSQAPDHNTTHDLTGTMALGRPWNNFSTTIYIDTFMGSVVNASG